VTLSNEDFVRAAYLGVLGRGADAAGLAHHLDALGADVPAETAARLLRDFIGSDEFRAARGAADALLGLPPPKQGPAIVHAASLGTECYASWTLKQMGLKRYSLPFDWLFSSLPMVLHCLEDDFATFLDPRHYRPVPLADRPAPHIGLCDHAHYAGEFGVRHVFNHFDPSELTWHAYLVRAVGRFRRLLASPAPKLFFATVRTAQPELLVESFTRLAALLDRSTAKAELHLLAIVPPDANRSFSRTVLTQVDAHRLTVWQPYTRLDGLVFEDAFDDLFVRRMLAEHSFDVAATI
jgi:hypothetical protein